MVVTVSTWVRVYGYKTSYSTFYTMWLEGELLLIVLFTNTNINAFNLKLCVTYIGY